MMSDPAFSGMRRAVVSPEDTTVSAGGGVALRLLTLAGPRYLLNELTKLPDVAQAAALAVRRALSDQIFDIFRKEADAALGR